MDSIIQQAYQAGIPVVDDLGPTTTPYAENFDENFYFSGVKETQYLVNAIHGKGNLLDVVGIPGETIDVEYQSALKSVLSHYPGVHNVGQVVGKVTDTIAQGAVLQFLSTHPQRIDAVFQEGGMGAGIIAAFQQEKRPLPALVFVGSGAMVSIFHDSLAKHQNPHFYALTDPPGFCMKKAFDVLIRLLEGQHPKNLTIFYSPPEITAKNVNSWWNSKLTPTTTAWPEPPYDPFPDSVINKYFTNGRAP
jgi:ribose transport system substrate-binding protein